MKWKCTRTEVEVETDLTVSEKIHLSHINGHTEPQHRDSEPSCEPSSMDTWQYPVHAHRTDLDGGRGDDVRDSEWTRGDYRGERRWQL